MSCPVCGSNERVELSPGYFECKANRIKGVMPAVGVQPAQPVGGRCGTKYQEGVGFALARCYACGLNSVGFCSCHNNQVCGNHFKYQSGLVMCLLGIGEAKERAEAPERAKRAAEYAEYSRKEEAARDAFIEALQAFRGDRAALVLAVIGRCKPSYFVSEGNQSRAFYKTATLDTHRFAWDVVPELPGADKRPWRWGSKDCLPENLDDEVGRWFVKKAASLGIKPNSGVVVEARRRVFGEGAVYRYAPGWRFPGAGEDTNKRSGYLSTSQLTVERLQYIDHTGVGLRLSGERDTKDLRLSMTSLFGMAALVGLADPDQASQIHPDVQHQFVPRQNYGLPYNGGRAPTFVR